MDQDEIKRAAEAAIAEKPGKRIRHFTLSGETYWVKRKLSNGRNGLVKYSAEKEFFYEIARLTIAGAACPDLVPEIALLTPDYMVTKDGGPTLRKWLSADIPQAEKEALLARAGAALAELHARGIVHGRPALRDITYRDGKVTFLDWENRMYMRTLRGQKAMDFLLLLQGICREEYKEEAAYIRAAEKGYTAHGGAETVEDARRLLKQHPVIGALARLVKPFHWTDVEPVRKLYEHLGGKR